MIFNIFWRVNETNVQFILLWYLRESTSAKILSKQRRNSLIQTDRFWWQLSLWLQIYRTQWFSHGWRTGKHQPRYENDIHFYIGCAFVMGVIIFSFKIRFCKVYCTSQWNAPHPPTRGMPGNSGEFLSGRTLYSATVPGDLDGISYVYQIPGTMVGLISGISLTAAILKTKKDWEWATVNTVITFQNILSALRKSLNNEWKS